MKHLVMNAAVGLIGLVLVGGATFAQHHPGHVGGFHPSGPVGHGGHPVAPSFHPAPHVAPAPPVRFPAPAMPVHGSASAATHPSGISPTIRQHSASAGSTPTLVRPSSNGGTLSSSTLVRPGSNAGHGSSSTLVRPGSNVATNAAALKRPDSTSAGTSGRSGISLQLTVTEFTGLIAARQNVGPSAQNAINAALAGRLLTGDQRTALRGALEKGNLTPSQKGAIAAALQSDLDEKRLLAASGGRVTDLDNGGFNPETVDPAVVSNDGGYIPAPTESAVVNAPNSGIQTASFTPQPDNGNRALPLQEGRRLRVENKTNRVLTVYVQTQDMTQPVRYSFDAGRTATITTAQGPLVAKHLWVWAESGPREWLENKENALILAAEAYQAVEPEVRTISFE